MRLSKRQLAILLSVWATACCAGAQTTDPYEAALRKAGISTTADGISKYLLSLIPNEENEKRAAALVKLMSNESFLVREQAEQALSNMPNPPLELLQSAAESDDPETRYRAKAVLAKIDRGGGRSVTHAVYAYIAQNQVPGLAYDLLQYLPYSGETSAFGLSAQAVLATVTHDDLDLVRKAIKRKHPIRRAIAVSALARLQGEKAVAELQPLLQHEDDVVRLAAAQALANLGKREALAPLVDLLEVDDLEIRSRSVNILRSFTHQQFHYTAYDVAHARGAAIVRWRTWLNDSSADAELHFPLKTLHRFHGRTLISLYPKALREIDAKGNELMHADGFQYVWGCHATADGIRVVADFSLKQLVEYDATGEEVLRLKSIPGPPADIQRLPNGRFLLALAEANKVIEMDRDGTIAWSIDLEGRPTTANRLGNGNTLVNLQFGKRVVEVDPTGKVVWQLTGMNNALTAQALANGHVLVCEMNLGQAIEYNRAGEKVWELDGLRNACQAQRLPSGNTLVSDSDGLHEYNSAKEKVWNLDVPRGRFWRY